MTWPTQVPCGSRVWDCEQLSSISLSRTAAGAGQCLLG